MPQSYANLIAGSEPQLQNMFILTIDGVEAFGEGQTLQIALRSAVMPSDTSDEVSIPTPNGMAYFAGKSAVEPIALQFSDFVDRNTAYLVRQWRNTVYDTETDTVGLASVYKKTGILSVYANNWGFERSWTLHGVWPTNANYGALDLSSSETILIDVNIRYDRAVPLNGFDGPIDVSGS